MRRITRRDFVATTVGAAVVAAPRAVAGVQGPRAMSRWPSEFPALGQTVNGHELVYHVEGTGPLLIVWPGGAGMGWEYMRMPEVEKHTALLYVEPVGTGASGRLPPSGYTLAGDVADLEALRVALGLDRVSLLGHSYGGAVVLSYAIARPGRLAKLILLDTAPTFGSDWQDDVDANMAGFAAEPWFADAMAANDITTSTAEEWLGQFRRQAGFYFFDYTSHKTDYDALFAKVRFWMDAGRRMQSPYDVRAQLSTVKVPTLIVVGVRDAICSPKFARQMNESIVGSKLIVLEHSGHLGHVEEPRVLAAALDAFIP